MINISKKQPTWFPVVAQISLCFVYSRAEAARGCESIRDSTAENEFHQQTIILLRKNFSAVSRRQRATRSLGLGRPLVVQHFNRI